MIRSAQLMDLFYTTLLLKLIALVIIVIVAFRNLITVTKLKFINSEAFIRRYLQLLECLISDYLPVSLWIMITCTDLYSNAAPHLVVRVS